MFKQNYLQTYLKVTKIGKPQFELIQDLSILILLKKSPYNYNIM